MERHANTEKIYFYLVISPNQQYMFHSHRRPLLIGEDFKTFNELELEVFLFLFFKAGVEEGEETVCFFEHFATGRPTPHETGHR